MKMKKSISKVLNLNLEGLPVGTLCICDNHYDAISHLMVCALCKRKLMRNHIYYVSQVRTNKTFVCGGAEIYLFNLLFDRKQRVWRNC